VTNALAVLLASSFLAFTPIAAAGDAATRPESSKGSYRLDYVLFERDGGKRVNERSFSLTANEGVQASLRTGTRVPVAAGEKGTTYVDVGLKISGRVLERVEGEITLETEVQQSVFARPEMEAQPRSGPPVLRTVSESVSTRLDPGKPVLLASVEDATSRRQMQVEVTLSRVK
jgi:hypothetical protein